MERLYFAYGSNLLAQRLVARCPSAKPIGRALLPGHRVAFAKRGWMDGSGKAAVLPAEGLSAPGVVYALSTADLDTLDAFEGVGKGYDRADGVRVAWGAESWDVSVYVPTDPGDGLRPFDWYKALVVAGALQHGLEEAHVAALRAVAHDPDPDHVRPGRVAAIEALSAAGHVDWSALLRP